MTPSSFLFSPQFPIMEEQNKLYNMIIKNQFLKSQLHYKCQKMSLLIGVTNSTVSCWDPQPSSIRSNYYKSRPDKRMRWVEEWKDGWTAGGLHKHRKYHCYVGSASSSLVLPHFVNSAPEVVNSGHRMEETLRFYKNLQRKHSLLYHVLMQ